jgi:hypothetical protein
LIPDLVGVTPNVIPFQYNPEKLTHSLTPWNPADVDQTQRGAQAPTVQPFDPKETFDLTLEIDATDDLADNKQVAKDVGIADRLAALKKLTLPSQGLIGDLVADARALVGQASDQAVRPTVPIILFVWGAGRILPVRVKSFAVEETLFSPELRPLQAKVTLGLEVLTPSAFGCAHDVTQKLAIAAFNFTKLQDDALAVAHIANNVDAIRGLLPF